MARAIEFHLYLSVGRESPNNFECPRCRSTSGAKMAGDNFRNLTAIINSSEFPFEISKFLRQLEELLSLAFNDVKGFDLSTFWFSILIL